MQKVTFYEYTVGELIMMHDTDAVNVISVCAHAIVNAELNMAYQRVYLNQECRKHSLTQCL